MLVCVGLSVFVCVCHLKKPFARELETNTNEMNVSQVSATLCTFMGNFVCEFVCVCVLCLSKM